MAEKKEYLPTSCVTPRMRMAFVNLIDPRIKDDGTSQWGVVMLLDSDVDVRELKKMAENALINKWGADKKAWPKNLNSPFRSGDEESYQKYAGFEGKIVVSANNSKNAPGIVNANIQPVLDPQEVYSGRWAKAHVRAYGYDKKGNKGVAFWLENVQLLEHDDCFGGGTPKPQDVFQKETVANRSAAGVDENDMPF